MKTNLLKISMWLFMGLFYININAQANPELTTVNTITNDVTVTNTGDTSIDISNYWVCLGPGQYRQLNVLPILSGDYTLSQDESVTFDFPLITGENADGAGGLGLFTTNSFGSTNSNVFVDYMQWGGPNQDRSAQAVSAGIWNSATAFISCPTPYIKINEGGNPTAWGEADAGIIGIDVDATNAANTGNTLRIDGEFAVSICVDGNPDPIVVFHDTPITDRSYKYVITDATTNVILNIVEMNEISLDGAGSGICQIWGWNYSGLGGGADFIGGPLQALRDANCSDISDQAITVIREAADAGTIGIDIDATNAANTGNTLRIDGDFAVSICVDGNPDPIVVFHDTPAENLTYKYVITDVNTGNILAFSDTNEISLDGAGVGVCAIWGWSYRGLDEDLFIGEPLQALRDADCSDISVDSIVVTREEADAGIIGIDIDATNAANTGNTLRIDGDFAISICVDGNPDPIVVFHDTPAENLTYKYVITDVNTGNILAFSDTNEISLDGAGVGVCAIWGWSYRGLDEDLFIGEPLQALRDADCSDISVDSIVVTREEADAGIIGIDVDATNAANTSNTLRIDGEFEITLCVDGIDDPIIVSHTTPSENLSYLYVITDNSPEEIILNIVGTNEINLDGAGVGVCRIWGWSYRGLGGQPGALATFGGGPLQALRDADCSDISEDSIVVTRLEGDDCDLILAIDDVISDEDFSVFPNPVKDTLTISYTGFNGVDIAVVLYDISGRIVSQNTFNAQNGIQLNTTGLLNGIYLVNITDIASGETVVKRVIKE